LHFADKLDNGNEQYILTFTPRPNVFLAVEAFEGAPEGLSAVAVSEIKVRFNKNIVASTFTSDDIHLICQGDDVDAGLITITKITDNEFNLDLSGVTQSDGYYVLTVQTAGIQDYEGYAGETGKTVSWNQYIGGKVQFNLKIEPENAGEVTPLPGMYDFGSVLNLNAVPSEGYLFERWSINGETLSTETAYNFTLLSSKTVTASFKRKLYDVVISYDNTAGKIVGGGTGKYEHGTSLVLTAELFSGYRFAGWVIGGEIIETGNRLAITIHSNLRIDALFEPLCELSLVDLGEDLLLSDYNPVLLNAGSGFASYLWSTGATTQHVTIENPEKLNLITVWVKVSTIDNCVGRDTIQLVYNVTGIINPEKNEFVEVFPNPAKSKITILFAYPEPRTIRLYDLKGSLYYSNKHNEKRVELQLNHLKSGIYILKIDHTREIKIIVNREN
jgi:hypothetical protein